MSTTVCQYLFIKFYWISFCQYSSLSKIRTIRYFNQFVLTIYVNYNTSSADDNSNLHAFNHYTIKVGYKCTLQSLFYLCTVVCEKLVVGNIHEKKSVVKNFRLSRLQTIINCSISLWKENLRVINFRCTWCLSKIFSCRIFPKLWY